VEIELEQVEYLRFGDGRPVRGASAIAPFGSGWLIAQDDSAHACWWGAGDARRVRVHPGVEGHDDFEEARGTKHLKPDFEAACAVGPGDAPAVLLLGSGSAPHRTHATLLRIDDGEPTFVATDVAGLYVAVASALGCPDGTLNLEGACVVGDRLRWFQRGLPSAGSPTGSVELDLTSVLAVVEGSLDPASVRVVDARRYDLGDVDGVGLAVTEAVALDRDRVLVSAAAEDSPNVYDDGPVVGSVLAVLRGGEVLDVGELPRLDGAVAKVEGLARLGRTDHGERLLATVDDDDHSTPAALLTLRVRW
jgi:hypothetical protein